MWSGTSGEELFRKTLAFEGEGGDVTLTADVLSSGPVSLGDVSPPAFAWKGDADDRASLLLWVVGSTRGCGGDGRG